MNDQVIDLFIDLYKTAIIILGLNIQGVSKKGNRTLQCFSAFIIQSTEIILSQAERPGF